MEAKRARELTGKAVTVTDMGNDAGRFRGNRQPWLELGEAKSEGAGFSFTRAVYHHKVGGWDPRNETGMLNSNMNRVISAEAFTLTSRKPGFLPPFCGLVLHLLMSSHGDNSLVGLASLPIGPHFTFITSKRLLLQTLSCLKELGDFGFQQNVF